MRHDPPMTQHIRRGSPVVSPMPQRLDRDAWLRVSDDGGRILRQETLPPGTDLRDRLEVARENYKRQGWTAGELRPGQWAFIVQKAGKRLMVAIRQASSMSMADVSSAPRSAM
jgi:hypothetical protein